MISRQAISKHSELKTNNEERETQMKTKMLIVSLLCLAVTACNGDFCSRKGECASLAGNSFSMTECQDGEQPYREKYASQGCSSEHRAYEACLTGLSCDVLNGSQAEFERARVSACGGLLKDLNKCLD